MEGKLFQLISAINFLEKEKECMVKIFPLDVIELLRIQNELERITDILEILCSQEYGRTPDAVVEIYIKELMKYKNIK